MRILSIDPGFARCGVAILEKQKESNNITLLRSLCIETEKENAYTTRLAVVGRTIDQFINEYNPDCIAIEELFFNGNKKTALNIAEVRGIILFLAETHTVPVIQLNPLSVKIALTGYGKASKHQVMCMVENLIKIPNKKILDDEYDAIAIGITALATKNHKNP